MADESGLFAAETTVLGVGNVILRDEGFGVRVAEYLAAHYDFPESVQIVDGGTLGIELTQFVTGTRRLLVIDSINGHAAPGTLFRFEDDAVMEHFQDKISAHEVGIQDVLALLAVTGKKIPEVVVIGAQPYDVEAGVELSEKMRALVHYADLLTPNLTELCSLTGSDYRDGNLTLAEIENMCKTLAEQGPKHIVVTGIHYSKTQIMNYVYSKGEEPKIVMADRIGGDRSGTGDVISAVIAGMYLNGHGFYESVKKAADFASKCIRYCEDNNVPTHWGLCFEMYLRDLMED